jgi:hypothetical protein
MAVAWTCSRLYVEVISRDQPLSCSAAHLPFVDKSRLPPKQAAVF